MTLRQSPQQVRSRPTRTPTQDRAKRTVEKILNAASDHLCEQGLENFTTNTIAHRAGVNIATLYSYFPDKIAILQRLFEQSEGRRQELLAQMLESADPDDWRGTVDAGVDAMVKFRMQHPSTLPLRRAVLGTPQLRALDQESVERMANRGAVLLRQVNPKLGKREAERVAETTLLASLELLDSACSGNRPDRKAVAELKVLIISYLGHYLD